MADDTNFHGSHADQKGVMKQEGDLEEREETILARRTRDTQVQADSRSFNAIAAVGAVLILQWLRYSLVPALSAHHTWEQPCLSILQCFQDSSLDIQGTQDEKIKDPGASPTSVKGRAANWSTETISGYAARSDESFVAFD